MLYPLSYEGRHTKALVRGYETAAGWSNGTHLVILGRGLAAAYGDGERLECAGHGSGDARVPRLLQRPDVRPGGSSPPVGP